MDQHRTVRFFKYVASDFNLVIGPHGHEVRIERRVMQRAQGDAVRHRRSANRFVRRSKKARGQLALIVQKRERREPYAQVGLVHVGDSTGLSSLRPIARCHIETEPGVAARLSLADYRMKLRRHPFVAERITLFEEFAKSRAFPHKRCGGEGGSLRNRLSSFFGFLPTVTDFF
jgi:hypothetical protein